MSAHGTSKRISRREFARTAVAGATAAVAAPALLAAANGAQAGKAAQKEAPRAAAVSPRRRSIEIMEQFPVPMGTEPGFVFRP